MTIAAAGGDACALDPIPLRGYASAHLYETRGIYLPVEQQTPEAVVENWARLDDPKGEERLSGALKQTEKFIGYALAAHKSQS